MADDHGLRRKRLLPISSLWHVVLNEQYCLTSFSSILGHVFKCIYPTLQLGSKYRLLF